MPVTLSLQDNGAINFLDKSGKPLPSNLVQATKKQNRELILNWLEQQSEKYNSGRESLLKIHLNTPAPEGEVTVNPKPKPPKFQTHGLMSALFSGHKQKIDEKNKQTQQEYEKALIQWEKAEQALTNDPEVMSVVITNALASIEWPRETSVSFDIIDNGRTVLLDVDLPEIEDMPTKQAQTNKKDFRLITKEIPQSQIQLDYLTHIHAIGFRLIGDVFAVNIKCSIFGLFATR